MSRGTGDFTVQQLLDFLHGRETELKADADKKLPIIGQAFVNGPSEWLKRETADYHKKMESAGELEQFRYEVERRCGELHDKTVKLANADSTGEREENSVSTIE